MAGSSWIKKRFSTSRPNSIMHSRNKRGRRFLFVALASVTIIVAVGGVYLALAGSDKKLPDETQTSVDSPTEKKLAYHVLQDGCQGVDFQVYQDAVGVKPEIEAESVADKRDSSRMTCWLRADDISGSEFNLHNLGIVADVFQSHADAEAEYKNSLLSSGHDESKLTKAEGPWDKGVAYDIMDVDKGYGMDLVDKNVTVRFTQMIDPIDAMSEESSRELMTRLAKKLLAALSD